MSVRVEVLSSPVGVADRAAVLALEAASQQRPLGWDGLAAELGDDCDVAVTLVARDASDAIVAHASARRFDDAVHVMRLVVAEEQRRRGVGAALLAGLSAWARQCGAAQITLEVRAANAPALALYAREGFLPVGRRRGYYPDGEDAVVCTFELAETGDVPAGGR